MRNLIVAGLFLLVSLSNSFAQEKCIYEEAGYTKLFNGKDLTGWKIPDGDNGHWSVIESVIDYDAWLSASWWHQRGDWKTAGWIEPGAVSECLDQGAVGSKL